MTTEAAPQQTADGIATTWLAEFTTALARRDVNAAAGLFARESYWRDLVSFSWNLTTVEHADGVRDLLQETLDHVRPSEFELSEPAETADGVTNA